MTPSLWSTVELPRRRPLPLPLARRACVPGRRYVAPGNEVEVMVAAAVEKFDGTSMAGSIGALGSGDDAELLGAKVKLDLASILEKMKKIGHGPEDGEGNDESDSVTDQYDPDLVLEHATEVSKSLYRAVDAHHVQLLNKSASMSILVANYFKTSLSEKTGLYEGQIIETRHGRGPRSWTEARVERVNDDG